MPSLFEIVVHDGGEPPTPDQPYYLVAKEGIFLHRSTQIGTVLVKQTKAPPTLGALGFTSGVFTWVGPKIPARIISQATDFFRRIYTKHQSEAEVLITMHNETGAFRLFVPFQRVSGAGVKSVYEPTHIDPAYTVVGTLHSHCMMNAFHSGTDSHDASDMDGVHFTIGKVLNNPPEIVAMVAMNGTEFHYANPTDIADIQYDADTAPEWWDTYVYPYNTENTVKPKSLRSITQAMWDEFRGIVAARQHTNPKLLPATTSTWKGASGNKYTLPYHDWDREDWDWDWNGSNFRSTPPFQPTKDSQKFNRRKQRNPTTASWLPSGALRPNDILDPEQKAIDHALDMALDSLILTDEDWKTIKASDMDEIDYWRNFFADRFDDVAAVLTVLGQTVTYDMRPSTETTPSAQIPLPEQGVQTQ